MVTSASGSSRPGKYGAIFNSDSEYYGGSNIGVSESWAEQIEAQGKEWSIAIDFPPLGTVTYKRC